MIGCPLLVSLSNRPNVSRLAVLRACLSGNAIAALLTAVAGGWRGITIARILAGTFAASVPVAQVAVADVVPPGPQTSKALSRVASAASLGIVIGPAAGGLAAEFARTVLHVPRHLEPRFTFAASGLFALSVLLITSRVRLPAAASAAPPPPPSPAAQDADGPLGDDAAAARGSSMEVGGATTGRAAPPVPVYAQPIVRWIALVCSFSVTTGIAIYSLFAQRFLGYGQPQISAAQSSAAAASLVAQLILLPRMLDTVGEATSCVVGLLVLGLCTGANAIVRTQPYHFMLYVISRAGHAFTETSNAAITASASTPATRGRNLALLQSVRTPRAARRTPRHDSLRHARRPHPRRHGCTTAPSLPLMGPRALPHTQSRARASSRRWSPRTCLRSPPAALASAARVSARPGLCRSSWLLRWRCSPRRRLCCFAGSPRTHEARLTAEATTPTRRAASVETKE